MANIGTLFKTCSKETFGEVKKSPRNYKSKAKPWVYTECSRAPNIYHKCRKMYNRYKTNYYKNSLKIVSKKYKRTLTVINRKYKDNKIKELRLLKSTDPRKYWKIINSQNKTVNDLASLDDLYHFFKASNTQETYVNDGNVNYHDIANDEINEELNQLISELKFYKL